MDASGGSIRRSSLVDVVDAARTGDAEAVDALVVFCRPELLRLARSIDAAEADQVVDRLLTGFVGHLDRLHFDGTPEVWFHLYQGCRQLMAGGALADPPETIEPLVESIAAPTELVVTSNTVLQPTRLGVTDRVLDAISAQRSLITVSLLVGALLVPALLAASRWEAMHILDDVNLVSLDDEGVAEPIVSGGAEGGNDPASPLGPRTQNDDGGRSIFAPPSSDPVPTSTTTTSGLRVEAETTATGPTTTTAPTTSTTGPTTSTTTTVVSPVGPRSSVVTATSTTLAPLVANDQTPATTVPPRTTIPALFSP